MTAPADFLEKNPTCRRVMIVDDNEDAADSLGTMLELLGHEVCVAYSGSSALAMLTSFAADLILLDIGMPGMDGYEVARKIREQPQHEKTQLVALTGWSHEEDRRRSATAGFDRHLVKPVSLQQLKPLLQSSSLSARAE